MIVRDFGLCAYIDSVHKKGYTITKNGVEFDISQDELKQYANEFELTEFKVYSRSLRKIMRSIKVPL